MIWLKDNEHDGEIRRITNNKENSSI